MDFDEVLSSPGFWLLGGGAVAATIIGYIASKRMDMAVMPLWQLIAMIVVELIAAAYFSTRD